MIFYILSHFCSLSNQQVSKVLLAKKTRFFGYQWFLYVVQEYVLLFNNVYGTTHVHDKISIVFQEFRGKVSTDVLRDRSCYENEKQITVLSQLYFLRRILAFSQSFWGFFLISLQTKSIKRLTIRSKRREYSIFNFQWNLRSPKKRFLYQSTTSM